MATRKNAGKRSAPARKKARAKVGKAMREFKRGQLKSGGRTKVKSRKQAIAIGLSEARRAGADVPPRKSAAKEGASKKPSATKRKAPARRKSATRGRSPAKKR
jgi:hypothetical protein